MSVPPSPVDIYQFYGNASQYGTTHLSKQGGEKQLTLEVRLGRQVITLTEFIWAVLDRSADAKQLSSALDL